MHDHKREAQMGHAGPRERPYRLGNVATCLGVGLGGGEPLRWLVPKTKLHSLILLCHSRGAKSPKYSGDLPNFQ